MTRVAVVDIGTNSTRLLIADVSGDGVKELERRSIVTRLGEGLERTGRLNDTPMQRVFDVLAQYREAIDEHGVKTSTAVLTSAVRDAPNGDEFTQKVRDAYGLDAQTISGDEEARLTFKGATAARADNTERVLVVDIGGGSTELVLGTDTVEHHASTQVGVVRHTERHLHDDPPTAEQLEQLKHDARETLEQGLPDHKPDTVIAVAGTATMAAAMDLELESYDSAAVEGHELSLETLHERLESLASVPLDERKKTPGLHPDRAPTIVAGIAILIEVLDAVGATQVEVSDRDILHGRAAEAAPPT